MSSPFKWLAFLLYAGIVYSTAAHAMPPGSMPPSSPAFSADAPYGTAAAPPPVSPIRPEGYLGWQEAYRLNNGQAEAVLVPAIGRLVHFAPLDGASPFRLESSLHGQMPPDGDPFFNIGGDWLWPVSQARWASFSENGRDWPPPDILADLPWTCSAWTDALGAKCALLSREYGAPLHINVTRLFRLEPASTHLVIRQRIERLATSDIPVVLWNISQLAQTEHVVLPVDLDSRFEGGLKVLMGEPPDAESLLSCGDAKVYRIRPGAETKLGSDSSRSWIAAARETQLIFETASCTGAIGEYPDGGCVVELYSNEGLGYSEIETLSPEVNLPPGTVLENTLRIQLVQTPLSLPDCGLADQVRALAGETVPVPAQ
ncbi:MAG: hypothetical protein LBN38_03730 [Verrucomicrobiota bacterium]|nr:hypothetical protein [Verrucomicrobiota bacterium]